MPNETIEHSAKIHVESLILTKLCEMYASATGPTDDFVQRLEPTITKLDPFLWEQWQEGLVTPEEVMNKLIDTCASNAEKAMRNG